MSEKNLLSVNSPFDGKQLDKIEMSDSKQLDEMLNRADKLYKNRKNWREKYQNIEILEKLAILMEAEHEDLSRLIASEGGKPLIDARVEAMRAIDGVKIAISELRNINGEEIPMGLTSASAGRVAFTIKEPIGVVAAISAFNHPLNLAVHQVIPAVATGCPFILKPATTTPLSSKRLVELLYKAGLPKDWGQLCVCDNDVASELVKDKRIAFMSFIGSAKIGWMLKNMLHSGARFALEHGGVAPVIIDDTVNIDDLISPLIKGGFYHAGQVCVSVQRIFVPKSLIGEVAKKLSEAADKLIVGDPLNDKTEVGPLILPHEIDRVDEWVNEAREKSAKILCGGKKISDTLYAPTIILNPPADCQVSVNEIFGPVICLYEYDKIDDAIKIANSLDVSFQSAVFSENIKNITYIAKNLNASAVMVNDHTAFRTDWMPFAGYKSSGFGVGGIGHTMSEMLHDKMIVINNF